MNILSWIQELNECKEKGMKLFSIPELMNLSGQSIPTVRRTVVRLKEKGVLRPIYQGLWGYGRDITLEDTFRKIHPDSYISLETVLGRSNIINSMTPDLTCITLNQTRTVQTKIGTILFHQIKRCLFFGFDEASHAAFPEKALLDDIYLKLKRGLPSVLDDYNLSEINHRKLKNLLIPYPPFVKKFVAAQIIKING